MILQISQGPQIMTRENTREGREGEQNPKEAPVEVLVGNRETPFPTGHRGGSSTGSGTFTCCLSLRPVLVSF